MPEHLVQSASPLAHARRGKFLDTGSGGGAAAPHGWFDGLKTGVFLDEVSADGCLAGSYLHVASGNVFSATV